MRWTEAQQSAIDAPKPGALSSQTILVSAAAGSGKTAVLVERILQRLKQREVSVQELMVVTFTKAAAAEMKARIGAKLLEEFTKTQDPYLEEQLNLLPSAHISTLHSFCQWVIRSYFYQLDIDPSFTIGNEGELTLMRQDVLDAVLLEAYEQGLYHCYEVSDMFSSDKSDEALRSAILQVYFFAMAQSQPLEWIQQSLAMYERAKEESILENPWGEAFWKEQHRQVDYLLQRYHRAQQLAAMGSGFDKWMDAVGQLETYLGAMQKSETWDDMHRGIAGLEGFAFPQLRVTKAMQESDPAIIEEIKAILEEGKRIIQEMGKGAFAITEADWLEQLDAMLPLLRGLLGLVEAFYRGFQQAKQEAGMIDFSDLEHLCLALLVDPERPGEMAPSEVALELQEQFKEVMVDEYQDTNGVQEAIVNLVSKPDNRFYVGDVKQSIYGFRMADPSLFMGKYHDFSHDINSMTRRIDLSQNFRSHENILAVTNFIFSQIMTEDTVDLTYGEAEALHPGRVVEDPPPNWVGGSVEIHLLECNQQDDEDGSNDEEEDVANDDKEMLLVIDKMLALRESGATVQDKDGTFRPVEWKDMVILKRSIAGSVNRMIELMRQAGIPAYAEEKTGYFSAIEVQLVLSILQVIDNPEQDLPLAIILQSPLVGMDVNDLGRLRAKTQGRSLWSGLRAFVDEAGQQHWSYLVDSLERWRTLSRRQGVSDLLWDIYETLHLVEYVSAMPNGLVRRGNVMALYERAKQYESGNYRGLFRFLRFIESLQASGQDLSVAKTVSEADNVVRIMTIHKSKGLEFPVVFLMGTQKRFNARDIVRPLLLHKQLGVGLKGYFSDVRVMYPSLPWLHVKAALEQQLKAEEERILYVALTRPKDKLFITGFKKGRITSKSVNPASHVMGQFVAPVLQWGQAALSKEMILGCQSYLDWILYSVARHVEGGSRLRQEADVESPQFPEIPYQDCRIELYIHDGDQFSATAHEEVASTEIIDAIAMQQPVPATPLDTALLDRLTRVYPYQGATDHAAKISVSELKRRYQDIEELAKPMVEQHHQEGLDLDASKDLAVAIDTEGSSKVEDSKLEMTATEGENLEETSDTAIDLGPFGATLSHLEESASLHQGPRWGTLMHEAMQWLPLAKYTKVSLGAALDNLVLSGYLSREERQAVHDGRILRFFQSHLGQRLLAAQRVERELPFSLLFPADSVYPDVPKGEELFLQGIIDTAFLEVGGWILLDYKTDRIGREELVERYRIQLELYAKALEQLTDYPVREVYIYSFRLEEAIPI